ncbi:MAG: pyrroline-5-carboxylate reductase [Rhodocyclaceae bacterium]|nr:pyrroline-5-carboxylate reductase [Rhodocyclaceae bacterium]
MKITFLGGGNMANALIGGMIKQGFSAAAIQSIEPYEEARLRLTGSFGIRCTPEVDASALNCEVLVLSVKPQQMKEALAPMAGKLTNQLVVSIAAGIRLPDIGRWLGNYSRLVRAMPNTPALIGAGVTGLYAAPAVSAQERQAAERVLSAVGSTLWVDDEAMIDAVTAISGSGPAYVFLFIEALRDAALELGFTPAAAERLALDTFLGSAKLAHQSTDDVAVLRQRVTSKGGTTEQALLSLERDQVKAAVSRAVRAAQARGRELGEILGKD